MSTQQSDDDFPFSFSMDDVKKLSQADKVKLMKTLKETDPLYADVEHAFKVQRTDRFYASLK